MECLKSMGMQLIELLLESSCDPVVHRRIYKNFRSEMNAMENVPPFSECIFRINQLYFAVTSHDLDEVDIAIEKLLGIILPSFKPQLNLLRAEFRVLNLMILSSCSHEDAVAELDKIRQSFNGQHTDSISSLEKVISTVTITTTQKKMVDELLLESSQKLTKLIKEIASCLKEENSTSHNEPIDVLSQNNSCEEKSYENSRGESNTKSATISTASSITLFNDSTRTSWTNEMVNCLIAGVNLHGEGSWKIILEEYRDVFPSKVNNVSLKDKWRNLLKYRKVVNDNGKWKTNV